MIMMKWHCIYVFSLQLWVPPLMTTHGHIFRITVCGGNQNEKDGTLFHDMTTSRISKEGKSQLQVVINETFSTLAAQLITLKYTYRCWLPCGIKLLIMRCFTCYHQHQDPSCRVFFLNEYYLDFAKMVGLILSDYIPLTSHKRMNGFIQKYD